MVQCNVTFEAHFLNSTKVLWLIDKIQKGFEVDKFNIEDDLKIIVSIEVNIQTSLKV